MQQIVMAFHHKVLTTLNDCGRFTFLSRGVEFQRDAILTLQSLYKEGQEIKRQAVAICDEDLANQTLCYELMVQSLTQELKMWIAFKEDQPDEAWDHLVAAQSYARSANRVYEVGKNLEQYVNKLTILENLLFPPQTFMSIGGIVRKAECSICQGEYGQCDHVKGRPYMGEICARVIKEIDLKEVSLVDDPANRHCRVTSFESENGHRSIMTWRTIQGPPDNVLEKLSNSEKEKLLENT